MIGIYSIRQVSTGISYIGSSVNIEQRWKRHKTDLNCDRHHAIWLQRAWKKYGAADFKFFVIEEVENRDLLRKKEREHILRNKKTFNNLRPDSDAGVLEHSNETKIKMSISQKKRFKESPKGQLSDKQKKQISVVHKGKKVSDETRRKQSVAAKARCTKASMMKLTELSKGKRIYKSLTEEHKKKISEAHLRRKSEKLDLCQK